MRTPLRPLRKMFSALMLSCKGNNGRKRASKRELVFVHFETSSKISRNGNEVGKQLLSVEQVNYDTVSVF